MQFFLPQRSLGKKGRESEAVRLRNRVQQRKLIQQRKQFLFLLESLLNCARLAILMQKCTIGAHPSGFLAVLWILMHGRRQRAGSRARKIVTFPDLQAATFSSAKAEFVFKAPPSHGLLSLFALMHEILLKLEIILCSVTQCLLNP